MVLLWLFYPYVISLCRGYNFLFFFFSSRRRHTRFDCDWSSDVCSSDLSREIELGASGLGALLVVRRVLVPRRVHVSPEYLGRSPGEIVVRVGSPRHVDVVSPGTGPGAEEEQQVPVDGQRGSVLDEGGIDDRPQIHRRFPVTLSASAMGDPDVGVTRAV